MSKLEEFYKAVEVYMGEGGYSVFPYLYELSAKFHGFSEVDSNNVKNSLDNRSYTIDKFLHISFANNLVDALFNKSFESIQDELLYKVYTIEDFVFLYTREHLDYELIKLDLINLTNSYPKNKVYSMIIQSLLNERDEKPLDEGIEKLKHDTFITGQIPFEDVRDFVIRAETIDFKV